MGEANEGEDTWSPESQCPQKCGPFWLLTRGIAEGHPPHCPLMDPECCVLDMSTFLDSKYPGTLLLRSFCSFVVVCGHCSGDKSNESKGTRH